jgi:hypothetical protein
MSPLRSAPLFLALAFALSGCPKKDEPKKDEKASTDDDDKKKKKKGGDDEESDDEESSKKKKKKGDDEELDADSVCKHVQKLVKKEPDHKWAPRFDGTDKCKKQIGKFESKLDADAYAECLKCVNDAEDLDGLGKDCEKPCDKGKKKKAEAEDD